MSKRTLEELWQDPAHWTGRMFYSCAEDPRLFVPKRWRWSGFTLNLGHSAAGLAVAGILLATVSPLALLFVLPEEDALLMMMPIYAAIAVALVVVAKRESGRTE